MGNKVLKLTENLYIHQGSNCVYKPSHRIVCKDNKRAKWDFMA